MAKFTWLHLTDLHCGMKKQEHLWPNIRDKFFDDLNKLHDRTGHWDAVLFTGDLVQSGSADEFNRLNELLDTLWNCFGKLGSNPILLAVPGNHDLMRPSIKLPAVRMLTKWKDNPEIHEEFWEETDSEYRKTINDAFANYSAWWEKNILTHSLSIQPGMLPGDFSISIEHNGLSIGIVGLNITFLQLTQGDYTGRLAFDVRQLHKACGTDDRDSIEWIKQHHLCFLMTHQPPTWLDETSHEKEYAEIAPAGRFTAHLFGHMHEHMIHDESFGGGPLRRFRQGCSLFGSKEYGEENKKVARQHGYSIHQIEISDNSGHMRMWPRLAKWDNVNGWQINADRDNFSALEDDEGTPNIPIVVSTPTISAEYSASRKKILMLSSTSTSIEKSRIKTARRPQQLFSGWPWPHEEPELRKYCEALVKAHGYIRFVEVPFLKDTTDVEIDSLYVDPQFSTREIHADTAPGTWPTLTQAIKAIQKYHHLVLLGDPGSGKSTLVSCLTWQLSRPKIVKHNLWTEALGGLVPLPMILRDLKLRADISWQGLLDAFLEHRVGKLLRTRQRIEQLLESGRALVLLDGLDEIGDLTTRRRLRDAVQTGLSSYPSTRWILTSRIVGYEQVPFHIDAKFSENENLSIKDGSYEIQSARVKKRKKATPKKKPQPSLGRIFEVMYLSPFSDQQINKFSHNWYTQHEPESGLIREKSKNLVDAIHDNEGTQRLARIPYLLTLMALIHHKNAKLPHGRTELYDRIAAAYLDSIDARRELSQLPYSLAQKKLWLSEIAYRMQKRRTEKRKAKSGLQLESLVNQPEILAIQEDVQLWLSKAMKDSGAEDADHEAKNVLDYFARRSGLLLPRGEGQFAFMHLSLQEYFAACFLEPRLAAPRFTSMQQKDPSDEELLSWANEAAWRETFVLLFEKLADKPTHSEALLRYLFSDRFKSSQAAKQVTAMRLLAELIIDPYISLTAETRKQMRRQCWLWAFNYENCYVGPFNDLPLGGITRPLITEHAGDLKKAWQAAGMSSGELESKALRLNLSGCTNTADLKPLLGLKELRILNLTGCTHISTLSPLAKLEKLEELSIAGCRKINNLVPLGRLTRLHNLNIQGCNRITDLVSIAKLKNLRVLSLNYCKSHTYLQPLAELDNLEILVIDGAKDPVDLTPLSQMRKLTELHLHEVHRATDLTPLVGLGKKLSVCTGSSNLLNVPAVFDEPRFRARVKTRVRS